ncbi:ankyrin repeat-containing protein [Tanacetum coccineum]
MSPRECRRELSVIENRSDRASVQHDGLDCLFHTITTSRKQNEPTQGDIGETSNDLTQAKRNEFKELYASANEELYPGCDYVTRLDFMAKFTYFKVKDVMHIEKNVLESILNTLLMNEKSKDTAKARQDLKSLGFEVACGQPKQKRECSKPQVRSLGTVIIDASLLPYGSSAIFAPDVAKPIMELSKPEGSIAEGYVAEEALTFSSHYFRDVTTKFNRPDRNVDCPPPTCQFQVFKSLGKSIGLRSVIRIDHQELKKVIWYVLHNSPEIDTYRAKFKSEFPDNDMKEAFPGWFGKQMSADVCTGPSLTCVPTWNPIAGHLSMRPSSSIYKRSKMARTLLLRKGIGFLTRTGLTSFAHFRGQLGCADWMESSATREYPSLIHTFFLTHTVNGVFLNPEDKALYDEMLRLQGLGSNTETGVPYTEDEIMAIVRGGKQRGHIPGVGRVLPRQGTVIPPPPPCTHSSDVVKLKKREKVLTRQVNMFMKLFRSDDKFSQMLTQLESQPEIGGGSGSGGPGDDEQGHDEDDGEDGEDEDDS